MCSGVSKRFSHAYVVVERVFGAIRVENIPGVTNRAFADSVVLLHRIHGNAHILDPVETVKNPEHIDAGVNGLLDETLHHIVRIVGVANAIGTPKQHL